MGESVLEVEDPVVQGVGGGFLVVEVFVGEGVAEVMGVKVVLEEVQLGLDVPQVLVHDGEHLVELAEVGLGQVEDVEVLVDLFFGDEGEHGVAPPELGAEGGLVAFLELQEGDAVFSQLRLDAGDGRLRGIVGPAPTSGEELDRGEYNDQITK